MVNKLNVEETLNGVEKYLIEQLCEGFVTEENPDANSIEVPDIPSLIASLQSEDVLVGELADIHVQYTVEGDDGTFEGMGTRFIAFNNNDVKGLISFDEVIGERDGSYQGLTKEGFRNLLEIMI